LGGTGSNQAVAAARLGAAVELIARTGADDNGKFALAELQRAGVSTRHVTIAAGSATGIALIAVAADGENAIMVVAGANAELGEDDVAGAADTLSRCRVLLTQLETPPQAAMTASRLAKQSGAIVIHDPAPPPYSGVDAALFEAVDIVTPNAIETLALTGIHPSGADAALAAARRLRDLGAATAIIKMGPRGALVSGPQAEAFVPPFPVTAIDSVGAGDAFNGGLAYALDSGMPLMAAVRLAAACGALAVTARGAADAAPGREAVLALLAGP
jgi:ribokinase